MVSEIAVETLDKMREDGLEPTVRDIIRLNAVGLRLESARRKRSSECLYYLPRVAAISQTVSFRQPTIAHDVWLDAIERIVAKSDFNTTLAIKAFALSRPASELPDPDDPKSVKAAIDAYCEEMKDFTREQIYAAVCYALYGAEPCNGEYAESETDVGDDAPNGYADRDWNLCVAVGVMRKAQIYLWGMTAADVGRMTTEQVRAAVRESYEAHGLSESEDVRSEEADFYRTAEAIRERLLKEGKNNG